MKQAQKLAADEIERFKTQKQAEFTSQATTVSALMALTYV
jgi:hypothetical protein